MQPSGRGLVDTHLARLVDAVRAPGRVVVHAPPGTGKTTRVPPALVDAFGDRGAVVVLEPRRIAARAAADFVAAQRRTRVGEEVGFQVRHERCGGESTKLWYVTEGILTRRLVRDSFLDGVAVLVLDEFHERHLHSDLALAVALELQRTVRPDLGIVVMSATLDGARMAEHLGGCPVISVETGLYPVTLHYESTAERAALSVRVERALGRALAAGGDGGDILVFLPGVGEIRRIAGAIAPLAARYDVDVHELHGNLPLEEQRRVLRRGPRRRVVLSTNVAETALTLEGVTIVIDSGLARMARYDARHGFNSLQISRISRAAAEQRAGRAGRTQAGTCWRLWSAAEHAERLGQEAPEIQRLELAELVLHVRAWGLARPDALPWLDAPPSAAWVRAETLLRRLGALDAGGALTSVGRQMARLGTEPRLACMLLAARELGEAGQGALIAALAGERDVRRSARFDPGVGRDSHPVTIGAPAVEPASLGSDLIDAAELFSIACRARFERGACVRLDLDRTTLLAVERSRVAFARALGASTEPPAHIDAEVVGRAVLAAYPDRLCRRREPGSLRARMVGGTGVVLEAQSAAAGAELFIAIDADGGPRRQRAEVRVRSASAVRPEWLVDAGTESLREVSSLEFDAEGESVVERRERRYLDLPLGESVVVARPGPEAAGVLADAALARRTAAFAVGAAEARWLARLGFAVRAFPTEGWPAVEELFTAMVHRLCATRRNFAELRRVALLPELVRELGAARVGVLDRELPESLALPGGRRAAIHYEGERAPYVAARVQDLFGLAASPTLARGRVVVGFEILAPNQRPVQITRDLASFWASGYAEVRRELRGRYPKHAWPEDPRAPLPPRRRG